MRRQDKQSLLTNEELNKFGFWNTNKIILLVVVVLILWVGSLVGLYFIIHHTLPTKQIKVITTDKAPKPLGPYQAGKIYNGFGFISGQIGVDPVLDKLVSDNIKDQATQAMQNLKNIIQAGGSNMGNVLKCTIYLNDNMTNFQDVNSVYSLYFPHGNEPARATVAVKQLPLKNNEQALVQIQAFVAFP